MRYSLTPARVARLCLKELRESLRDRRTIVTLVLMPLLVYPLLSLVLNRALLTNMTSSQVGRVARIGVSAELQDSQLATSLALGYTLLLSRELSPVFLEEVTADKRSEAELLDDAAKMALPYPEVVYIAQNARQALREGVVDLLVTRRLTNAAGDPIDADDDPDWEHAEHASGSQQAKQNAEQEPAVEMGSRSPTATGNDAPNQPVSIIMDAQQLMRLRPEKLMEAFGQYQVFYRDGDPQSERALQLLERVLASFNGQVARDFSGGRYDLPLRLAATPLAMKSGYAELLATMVPLVLVLMTMAGAVYPAIDLTAGERERGTMESLIVSPTPAAILLLAKYSAVVTVALLTALANLGAMTLTLWVSGIGRLVFGENALSAGVVGVVLALLVLFTMFFAALLLAITSFAKSFKEAQAYLIPLMLLALTPGVMSLLPGLEFSFLLATVPLVNIILLAKEFLVGTAEWNLALVAVVCNGVYALTALIVASRLFGSNASMHGSQGSWRDLLLRPTKPAPYPSVDQMALTMAVLFPLYFVVSSSLPGLSNNLSDSLRISAVASFVLILGLPLLVSWYRNLTFASTFRMKPPRGLIWLPGVLLIACSAWMFAHEILIYTQGLIGTLQLERVASFQQRLQEVPLWLILFAFALTPAVCEEFMFRGFVLSSLHKLSRNWAVIVSALLFGLMHVLTTNVLALERFLPTTFLGLILGWIAMRTGSIWPGMLLHALHNGLLLSMSRFQEELKKFEVLGSTSEHFPTTWLVAAGIALLAGLACFFHRDKDRQQELADGAQTAPMPSKLAIPGSPPILSDAPPLAPEIVREAPQE
jgi:sodium transport system permease protein